MKNKILDIIKNENLPNNINIIVFFKKIVMFLIKNNIVFYYEKTSSAVKFYIFLNDFVVEILINKRRIWHDNMSPKEFREFFLKDSCVYVNYIFKEYYDEK